MKDENENYLNLLMEVHFDPENELFTPMRLLLSTTNVVLQQSDNLIYSVATYHVSYYNMDKIKKVQATDSIISEQNIKM